MKAVGFVATLVAACSAQPPDPAELAAREYRRENDRIETAEQFEERKRACTARGGAMHVTRFSSGRLPPTARELRLATCVSQLRGGRW